MVYFSKHAMINYCVPGTVKSTGSVAPCPWGGHRVADVAGTKSISNYMQPSIVNAVFQILFIYLFIYLWLCWVFISVRGLSPVAASGGHSSSRCAGLSLLRPLLLWSTGSRRTGSVVVAHGPSCSAACGIFPDQGSNPCPLHWQADSQPLRHQGSPIVNAGIETGVL